MSWLFWSVAMPTGQAEKLVARGLYLSTSGGPRPGQARRKAKHQDTKQGQVKLGRVVTMACDREWATARPCNGPRTSPCAVWWHRHFVTGEKHQQDLLFMFYQQIRVNVCLMYGCRDLAEVYFEHVSNVEIIAPAFRSAKMKLASFELWIVLKVCLMLQQKQI